VNERLRSLPSVDEVLARPAVRALAERVGRAAVKAAARAAIAEARARLKKGTEVGDEPVPDARVLELGASEAAPRDDPRGPAFAHVLRHTGDGRELVRAVTAWARA